MLKKAITRLLLTIGLILFSGHIFAEDKVCTESDVRIGQIRNCLYQGNTLTTSAPNVEAENFTVTGDLLYAEFYNNNTVVFRPNLESGARLNVALHNQGASGTEMHIDSGNAGSVFMHGFFKTTRYRYGNLILGNRNYRGEVEHTRVYDMIIENMLHVTVRSNVHTLAIDNLRIIENDPTREPFLLTAGEGIMIHHIWLSRLDRNTLFQTLTGLVAFIARQGVIQGIYIEINADELESLIDLLGQDTMRSLRNLHIDIIIDGYNSTIYEFNRITLDSFARFLRDYPNPYFLVNIGNRLKSLRFDAEMPLVLNGNDMPCLTDDILTMERIKKYILRYRIENLDTSTMHCRAYQDALSGSLFDIDRGVRQGNNLRIHSNKENIRPRINLSGVNQIDDIDVNAEGAPVYIGLTPYYNDAATTMNGSVRVNGAHGGWVNAVGGGGGGIRPVLTLNNSNAMTIRNNSESRPVQVTYGAGSSRNIQERPGSRPRGDAIDLSSCLRCMIINNVTPKNN